MPLMQSSYVRKPVDVPESQVGRFLAAGFRLVPVEKPEKKPTLKRRTRKSSE